MKIKKQVLYFCFLLFPQLAYSQGKNFNWQLGYISGLDTNVISKRASVLFDSNNVSVTPANFKMPFLSAQGNISDENGNLLIVSNGCWISDATLDTMQNGGGLNPSPFTSDWCDNTSGIPFEHSNVILPYPDDTTRYILFHQTGTDQINFKSSYLYYSIIDMTLNGGLGGVPIGQKNQTALQTSLNPGLACCRHANGRDWWIIAFQDSSSTVYKLLLTPQGIVSVTTQNLAVPTTVDLLGQMLFSPDGKKMAYRYYDGSAGSINNTVRLFDFDRCTGIFSNTQLISFTDTYGGLGLAFSPNSRYLYTSTWGKVIQMDSNSPNVQASIDTVAFYDGFAAPYPFLRTDFWMMYLAANGKIYISSGSGVIDLHIINNPDSSGVACDVQQHSLHIPTYTGRGNVYHPNYYLGCDTTQSNCPCLTGIEDFAHHNFKFSISPNPTNGNFKIIYLLPQNSKGVFEVFDVTGKKVFSYALPPWSTLQNFDLVFLGGGIYNCVITSANQRVSKKLAIIKN